MRRRPFVRLLGASIGGLALGCNGTIWSETSRRRPDAGAYGRDAGPVTVSFDGGVPARDAGPIAPPPDRDAGRGPGLLDAGAGRSDAGCAAPRIVTLHDTHAQSLYFDGTYGPTTGIVRVDDVVAGRPIELEFWHGHGGVSHRFSLGAADLDALARGMRVTLTTTEVEGHSHMLFVDPTDERWRVSGAPDRTVEIC